MAGVAMLPVPRMTLASELNSQTRIAPAKTTLRVGHRRGERSAAAAHRRIEGASAGEQRNRKGKSEDQSR